MVVESISIRIHANPNPNLIPILTLPLILIVVIATMQPKGFQTDARRRCQLLYNSPPLIQSTNQSVFFLYTCLRPVLPFNAWIGPSLFSRPKAHQPPGVSQPSYWFGASHHHAQPWDPSSDRIQ